MYHDTVMIVQLWLCTPSVAVLHGTLWRNTWTSDRKKCWSSFTV